MSAINSRREFKRSIFMFIADSLSTLSTCKRREVGCVLVDKRDRIISVGYNGVASGAVHCTDIPCKGSQLLSGEGLDLCEVIHAEANALLVCEKPFEIVACYTTTAPCIHCVKLLANTSCQEIILKDAYPHKEAEKLWLSLGRLWSRI